MKFCVVIVSLCIVFSALGKQESLSKTGQPINNQASQTKSIIKNIIFDLGGVLVKDKPKITKKRKKHGQKIYAYEPIQEVIDLFYLLKKAGFKVFALTNKGEKAHQVLLQNFAFMHEFDGIVTASEAQASKPDQAMYNFLLKKYLLKSEESLLIDDQDVNIIAAKALGIEGLVFSGSKLLVKQLQNLHILF